MRSRSRSVAPVHRISGPAELLAAVPYLVGFHPQDSIVLVGLRDGRLVVTARLDLADAGRHGGLEHVLSAVARGGAEAVVAVVYPPTPAADDWRALIRRLQVVAAEVDCAVSDALLVHGGRWWSLLCEEAACCPPEGRPLDTSTSEFAAAATYEGLVALPDRTALADELEPLPEPERARLVPLIEEEQRTAVQAVLRGTHGRREGGIKRALFAAARASDPPGIVDLSDPDVARYGVAVSVSTLRTSLWLAVDAGRLDGRPLWRDLARRLPSPFDVTPLVLYGWSAWRAGEATVAGMAAERAMTSDGDDPAPHLLSAAVMSGVNPHTVPRLRRPA